MLREIPRPTEHIVLAPANRYKHTECCSVNQKCKACVPRLKAAHAYDEPMSIIWLVGAYRAEAFVTCKRGNYTLRTGAGPLGIDDECRITNCLRLNQSDIATLYVVCLLVQEITFIYELVWLVGEAGLVLTNYRIYAGWYFAWDKSSTTSRV